MQQAQQAIQVYQHIPLRFVEVELDAALCIAAELNIYAYDAYLVRCALKYSAPLITLDRSLGRKAQEKGVQLLEVK